MARADREDPTDDVRTEVRKMLDGLPGEPSRSECGCLWKRVTDLKIGDATISGDVVVGFCEQHAWEASQPAETVRRIHAYPVHAHH